MSNIEEVYNEVREGQDLKTRTNVFNYFKKGDVITISRIQRYCQAGYGSASRVLLNLIEDGLVKRVKGCMCEML